jgi:ABC-2 type transport system permease protein
VSTAALEPIAVSEVRGGLRNSLRTMRVIWRRELLRFFRNRLRLVISLVQPVLFLFVLGGGLSRLLPSNGDVDYRTFIFPGAIALTVLFTALFSAMSIVWDREFGFLREMLVAPVRRGAIVAGKCAGGATVATLQGAVMLLFAGVVHVPYSPLLLLTLLCEIVLAAVALTAAGMMLAGHVTKIESFQAVVQFVVLPMFFLSGALFPVRDLPGWLFTLTRLDPLTYAVDPMRRAVFDHVTAPDSVQQRLNPGVTWGDWRLPVAFELALVTLFGTVMLVIAVRQFNRIE